MSETDLTGHGERSGVVRHTSDLHKGLVKLGISALLVRRQCRLGGKHRIWPQNREFLVHDAQLRVRRLGLHHQRRHLPAIRTVVVEELDQGYVAVRIADNWTVGIAKDFFGAVLQDFLPRALFFRTLLRLEPAHRFHDDLGMVQQIIAHAPLELILWHIR